MSKYDRSYQFEGGASPRKWITFLFTYNRHELALKAIESIKNHFPWGDKMIVDDGSTDDNLSRIMAAIPASWNAKCQPHTNRLYGGYYKNQRWALEYALSNNYDYCMFFEDDEQFLWKMPDYPAYIERVFAAAPDCIQIQPLFMRRAFHYGNTTEYVEAAGAYRTNRGFNTTAVWDLGKVRRHPDFRFISEFGDGLSANSAYWLRKGYRLYQQFAPTVAITPCKDTAWLKPLTEAQIHRLASRNPSEPCFQEWYQDHSTPIWHHKNRNRFYEVCAETVRAEDAFNCPACTFGRGIPVIKGEFAHSWIPSLKSHLDAGDNNPIKTRLLPKWRQLIVRIGAHCPEWLVNLRHFSLKNYLAYRRLVYRLRMERIAIQEKEAEDAMIKRLAKMSKDSMCFPSLSK